MPPIHFFLADTDHPLSSDHPLWQKRLPERKESVALATNSPSHVMTYGDYFNAITDFCTANTWHTIISAMRQRLQRPVSDQEIIDLSIFLEKHGALYHPARVVVSTPDQTIPFVVNVAASGAGRRTLPKEMDALERLGDQRPFGWLPTVYSGVTEPTPMFLADWFDGYHEFHLTRSKKNANLSIIVWDGAETPHLFTEKQSADLYRQASMILTACYNPVSTDQIHPWHHAAGDFVVREKGNTVDVKLITVRNYAPIDMLTSVPEDEQTLLDNLILFCLHLSIGMRLDRLDGVMEMVWAPETCLVPVIDGFFKGLDLTGRLSGFPDTFTSIFKDYCCHQSEGQLMDMARQLVQSLLNGQDEDSRIVDQHVERHVRQIRHCIQNQTINS
jgi:hypothetical protein